MTTPKTNTKYIDYLTEDKPIPGQLWVCVSFLSPEGIKNCSVRGLKVRGVFGTKQEADQHAEELQQTDPDFHIFVGEVGKWLPWDSDPNDVQDNRYQEKELNDLMKGYKDNLEKSKRMQRDRKESMIKEAAREEQAKMQNMQNNHNNGSTKDRLRKKLEAKKQQEKMNKLAERSVLAEKQPTPKETELKAVESELMKEEELAKLERERLNSLDNHVRNTEQNLETIDSKLSKIQELYEKLNKK